MIEGRLHILNESMQHLCHRWCSQHPRWCTEQNIVTRISNIYMNHRGEIHVCSDHCDSEKVFSDGFLTCTISGIRYAKPKYVNTYQANHEYHRTSSTVVRVHQHHLKNIAHEVLFRLLFSKKRFKAEKKRLFDVQKDIKKMWVKMKRNYDKTKQHVNVLEMINSAHVLLNRRIPRTFVIPTEDIQKIICKFYTDRINDICLKLKYLTPHSAVYHGSALEAFITAILFIMRQGLRINDVEVISKDHYLASALPEANSLDIYNIQKTHFTNCRNCIQAAIRDALHIHYMSPFLLISSSYNGE
nr:hypothetical protein [Allomuricauda sp.]